MNTPNPKRRTPTPPITRKPRKPKNMPWNRTPKQRPICVRCYRSLRPGVFIPWAYPADDKVCDWCGAITGSGLTMPRFEAEADPQ